MACHDEIARRRLRLPFDSSDAESVRVMTAIFRRSMAGSWVA